MSHRMALTRTCGARKGNVRTSNGHRWRQAKARLRKKRHDCWICRAFGRDATIDYALPPEHPESFSADHLVPGSKGGAMYADENLEATHRRCNEWRRERSVAEVLAIARRARMGARPVSTTTEW